MAHGSLLISIALGLGSIDVPQPNAVALVGTTWRFLKPVKPGMTVHAVWRLARKRDVANPRWGLAVWHIDLDDQNDEHLLEGEVTVLVNRGEVAPAVASRSRRRRRGKAPAAAAVPEVEVNLPDPAPADTPAPASRRRRPSKPAVTAEAPEPSPAAESTPPGADPAVPSTSSRRRRRRRGGGGGGSQAAGNGSGVSPAAAGGGSGGEAGSAIPAPARAPSVPDAPAPDPPRSQWASPEPAKPVEGNPVTRVLGRLRRTRPAAPTAEGTRSPSE